LLCVLATPAFAAPTMTVVKAGAAPGTNGYLNASGDWVFNVVITPDYALVPDASGTPLGTELGFTSNRTALTATMGSGFDTNNPGKLIFGWEVISDTDDTPGIGPGDEPVGIQIGGTGNKNVFAALGSDNKTSGDQVFLQITLDGPTAQIGSALDLRTATVNWLGGYSGNGRIAQVTGGTAPNYITSNFDSFLGQISVAATPGDTNLTGGVDLTDFNNVLASIGTGTVWQQGNFKGTGVVDLTDFNTVLASIGQPSGTPGAGAGGGGAVPEPATAALVMIGALGCMGFARRRIG
jgi:hypothetical protein